MKVVVKVRDVNGLYGGDDDISWGEISFDVDCKDLNNWREVERKANQAKFKAALEKLKQHYIFAPGDTVHFEIEDPDEERERQSFIEKYKDQMMEGMLNSPSVVQYLVEKEIDGATLSHLKQLIDEEELERYEKKG